MDGSKFEEKLAVLETIIQQGMEKLLKDAERNDILQPPYGRRPEPTPLISVDAWEVR